MKRTSFYYLAVLSLTTLVFGLAFGWNLLNPFNLQWLMVYEDPSNHLAGWLSFANESWTWPPGKIQNLLHPIPVSLGTTDSIPLVALGLKLLMTIFPFSEGGFSFQYLGPYLYFCFLAQALVSFWVLNQVLKIGSGVALAGSLFFVLAPTLINRLLPSSAHIALCSHYLIIASIGAVLTLQDHKARLGWWFSGALLAFLASLIHPFLLLMVLSLYLIYYFFQVVLHRVPWSQIYGPLLLFGAGLTGLYLGGYFLVQQPKDVGLGTFGTNLLTFFDPNQLSLLLPDLPTPPGQYEGMAYLGLGGLFLLVIELIRVIRYWFSKVRRDKKESHSLPNMTPLRYSAGLVLLTWAGLLFLFSLSPEIRIGPSLVIDYQELVDKHFGFLAILRSSGRFVWPLYYCLLFYLIHSIYFRFKQGAGLILMAIALQFIDLSFIFEASPIEAWTPAPTSVSWAQDDFQGIREITFLPPVVYTYPSLNSECENLEPIPKGDFLEILRLLGPQGVRFNSGFASRFSPSQSIELCRLAKLDLQNRVQSLSAASAFSAPGSKMFILTEASFKALHLEGSPMKCQFRQNIGLCR